MRAATNASVRQGPGIGGLGYDGQTARVAADHHDGPDEGQYGDDRDDDADRPELLLRLLPTK